MATILDSYDFTTSHDRKYNWDEWLDGKTRRLEAEDLGGSIPKYFANQARNVAKRRGLKILVHEDKKGGFVILKAEANGVAATTGTTTESRTDNKDSTTSAKTGTTATEASGKKGRKNRKS